MTTALKMQMHFFCDWNMLITGSSSLSYEHLLRRKHLYNRVEPQRLRSGKKIFPKIFVAFYLQKLSSMFLVFPDNFFSSGKEFTVISCYVKNIFYSNATRSRLHWLMWIFTIFFFNKTNHFCFWLCQAPDYCAGK